MKLRTKTKKRIWNLRYRLRKNPNLKLSPKMRKFLYNLRYKHRDLYNYYLKEFGLIKERKKGGGIGIPLKIIRYYIKKDYKKRNRYVELEFNLNYYIGYEDKIEDAFNRFIERAIDNGHGYLRPFLGSSISVDSQLILGSSLLGKGILNVNKNYPILAKWLEIELRNEGINADIDFYYSNPNWRL